MAVHADPVAHGDGAEPGGNVLELGAVLNLDLLAADVEDAAHLVLDLAADQVVGLDLGGLAGPGEVVLRALHRHDHADLQFRLRAPGVVVDADLRRRRVESDTEQAEAPALHRRAELPVEPVDLALRVFQNASCSS
jgi:hypothetical protein